VPYTVQLPNGQIVEVDDSVEPTRAAEIIRGQFPDLFKKPESPGFSKSFTQALGERVETAVPAAKLYAGVGDEVAATQDLLAARKQAENQYRETEFSDIGEAFKTGEYGKGFGLLKDKFKEVAGASLGSQTPAIAAGIGASAIGTPVAGLAAYGVTALGSYLADNIARQKEENPDKDINRLRATTAATAQAGLDVLGGRLLGINKLLGIEGSKAARETAEEILAAARNPNAYKKAIATGAAKGLAFEVPQEVTQQVLERWQAGLALDPFEDPQAAKEYADAAGGALLLGGPLGVAGSVGRTYKQRAELAGIERGQREEARQAEIEAQRLQQARADREARVTRGELKQAELFTPEQAPVPEGVAPIIPEVTPAAVPEPYVVPKEQMRLFNRRGSPTPEAAGPVAQQAKEAQAEELRLTGTQIDEEFVRAMGVAPTAYKSKSGFLKPIFGEEITPETIDKIKDALYSYSGTSSKVMKNIEQILSRPEFAVTAPKPAEVPAPVVEAPAVEAPAVEPIVPAAEPIAPVTEAPAVEPIAPKEVVAPESTEVIKAEEPVVAEVPAVEEPVVEEVSVPEEQVAAPEPIKEIAPDELIQTRLEAKALARRIDAEAPGDFQAEQLRNLAADDMASVEELQAAIADAQTEWGVVKKPAEKVEVEEAVRAQRGEDEFAGEAEAADIDALAAELGDNLDSFLGRPGRFEVVPEKKASGSDVLASLTKLIAALVRQGAKTLGDAVRGVKKILGPKAKGITQDMYAQAHKAATAEKVAARPELTEEGKAAEKLNTEMKNISNPNPEDTRSGLRKMIDGTLNPGSEVSAATRFRRQVADKDAAVIEKLRVEFDNAVYDSIKGIRGDIALAQAQDNSALAEKVISSGGIRFNKYGLAETYEKKDSEGNSVSLDRVLDILTAKLGKKLGSPEEAVKLFENAAIAQRANELNKRNAKLETDARAAEAKGNKAAAKKLRDQKIEITQTPEEIKAGLQAFQSFPELQEAYKTFREFSNGLVDFLVASGRIDKETGDSWKNTVGYIPWQRVQEKVELSEAAPRSVYRNMIRLTDVKSLDKEGSKKEIKILNNMVGLANWAINTGMNNYAARITLPQLPDAEKIENENAAALLRKKFPNRVVNIYEKGERTAYLLGSEYDMSAFQSVAPAAGPLLRLFSIPATVTRNMITHMPNFSLSQLVQDGTYRAALMSGVRQPFEVMAKSFGNFLDAYKGEGVAAELANLGVVGLYDGMPDKLSNNLRERFNLKQVNAFQKAWRGLERFSLAADLAVRSAIYDQTMQETGDQVLAYHRAKEYINFKRRGVSPTINTLRQVVPFMGAYIQGMDVLYRTMTGQGVAATEKKAAMKLFLATGIKLAVLNMIYTALVSGEDDYEGADEFVKDKNYIIPGTGIKIPVAGEVGFLFKVLPERIYNYILSQGTEREIDATALNDNIKAAFVNAFSGTGITPQLVKPMLEASVNYSFFYEGPIVPINMQKTDVQYQVREGTSEIAKLFSNIGVSPLKADYIIRAYTGIAGAAVLDMTDSLFNPERTEKPLYKSAFLKTFMYDTSERGYKAEFYKFREKVDEVVESVNLLSREGRAEDLNKYLTEDKIKLYQFKSVVNEIEKNMTALRRARQIYSADTELSPEERRELISEIEKQEADMLKLYNIRELRRMAGL